MGSHIVSTGHVHLAGCPCDLLPAPRPFALPGPLPHTVLSLRKVHLRRSQQSALLISEPFSSVGQEQGQGNRVLRSVKPRLARSSGENGWVHVLEDIIDVEVDVLAQL